MRSSPHSNDVPGSAPGDRAGTGLDGIGGMIDAPVATVPGAYRGLWRRTLLTAGDGRVDRDTRVFWMQTACIHIDIRVPATRRTFGAATSLADLQRDQLGALATQMGFAGVTTVDTAAVPAASATLDRCTWRRQIDFSPPDDAPDVGTMRFETPGIVLEDGIDAEYHERWERDPSSVGVTWAMRLSQREAGAAGLPTGHSESDAPALFVARCGNFFMLARNRSPQAQAVLASYRGQRLVDVIGNPALDIDAVRALLDFEISLGRVQRADGARWTVDLSTLPWREGQAAFASDFTGALDRLPDAGRVVQPA